jgi:hypothetical protein
MKGVTKDGAPFTGSLTATASLKTTFGDDPNDNCELENVQVPNLQSLTGSLTCKNGRARARSTRSHVFPRSAPIRRSSRSSVRSR